MERIPASPRYAAALRFAHRAHAGQYRKGTTYPYIGHPLAVGGLALQYGADEDVAIAALLHDVVEDAGGAPVLARIRWAFGERVAAIVDACSDTHVAPKPAWEARKGRYIERLRIAETGSGAAGPMSEEHRELLRSLGYVHDGAEGKKEP